MAPGASVQRRWLITLPTDQLRQATAIAARPCGDARKPAPCVSIKTPESPTAMPAASSFEGYTFQIMLIAAIMIGTTAMKATASPDSTDCSAYAVLPMPPPSISVPTRNALRHCTRVGQLALRARRIHAMRNAPATRKRVPI